MRLAAVCSAKGSPGVTTTALAIAVADPLGATSLLVEADPAGGDLASRLGIPCEPGLASLAAAGRRRLDAELVEKHCQRVGGVDIVAAPAGASSARAALKVLDGGFVQALKEQPERVVICDAGRLDASSIALDLVKAADMVLVLTRCVFADLAHLAEEQSWWRGLGPPVALVLSEAAGAERRERYPAAEISSALDFEVLGSVAWDPKGVAALFGHRREVRRSALVQSAHSLVAALVQRLPGAVPARTEVVQTIGAPLLAGPAPGSLEL
jgi:MinD-like ATPase involved in chromosome partitioning or flagellar assembly